MDKSLHANLKSPTRGSRAKDGTVRNRFLPVLVLLAAFLGFQQKLLAQSSTITTTFANNNGTGTTTFNLQNTNAYDIIISEIGSVTGISGSQTATLYYKTTPINGAPGIIDPSNGWTLGATGTFLGVANTTTTAAQPMITNASVTIPAGATYGIAVSSEYLRYSSLTAGTHTVPAGGVNLIAGTNISYGGGVPPAAPGNTPRGFIGYITFAPAPPCVAPPTAGQAVSTVATVCPNTNFKLSLTGASSGMGMTYQWQSSANGTTGWANITGATTSSHTATQTTTTWYRAVLTCSGQTANALPVQVTTTATPVTGTFTINKGIPASATNFQSFTAAIASIDCGGASGPITFNVVAGSGPYNENVVIPVIPGASATNTITFNGNGNLLKGTSTTGTPTLKLDGADYIRINNLNIETEATATGGQVVHLTNGADNNIFTGNTINHVGSLTVNTGSYALYILTGSNNNNKFQNNTIIGGYYGVYNHGTLTAIHANNQFIGNTIKDQHSYAMSNSYASGTLIEGNDISRPTRTNGASLYGIYLTTGSTGAIISKNRIHNTHDVATSTVGSVYGIYVGAAGTLGTETIIKNNAIYNINASGASVYALYNSGGDNTYYFHNTVSADNPSINYGTIRGMYFLSASTNVKFQNNIINFTSPATSKHAIYISSTTIALQSNGNNLYAPNGNIGYWAANRTTLADWQTASSKDGNSFSFDPMFKNIATGDLNPINSSLNGVGIALTPPVTDDIVGTPRTTTAPDPGAYEFTPAANDAGITVVISPTNPVQPTVNQPIQVTIKNYGLSNLTTATITATITGAATQTITYNWTGNLATNATANATIGNFTFPTGAYTVNVCTSLPNGVTDPNPGNDCFSTPIISCTALAGLYTINKNNPTAGTNFTSITDAVNRVNTCGISGPVTFDVVAGTGPYNEQMILAVISGASATNTVTFNGNGNTLSASPGASALGVVTLNGTDFVKVNNFNLTLDQSATAGCGVQLLNGAENNILSNNTINLSVNFTSSNFNGIISGLTTSSAGINASNNKIQNNTIIGGYYGIRLNGTTGGAGAANNEITGNTIKDVYNYNIYLMDTEGTLIQGNDMSRPTRPTPDAFYGVFLTGSAKNTMINKNRFHNAFGAATTSSAAYIFSFSSVDAPAGSENIIKNNVVYDINTNGTIYGLYNVGSDGTYFYHNTLSLDHPSNTGAIRGVYQTTAATNIKVMNNIFTISGTSGAKHGLYFGAATSTIQSNYNDIFVTNGSVGYYGADFATLALWKTANSGAYDQNSISADPIYSILATGNLEPTAAAVNNTGTPLPAVTDDIMGNPRSTTTPDMGAYEFSLNPNDAGITLISGPVSDCSLTNAEAITVTIKNYGTSTKTTIPVSLYLNTVNLTPTPETWTGSLAPNATTTYTFTATANLSTAGLHTIIATTNLTGDSNNNNNPDTLTVTNAFIANLPVINFETPATGINAMRILTGSKSNVTENTAASLPLTGQPATSTKGMIMDGTTATGWVVPASSMNPWTSNPDHLAGAYMCFSPTGGPAGAPLWLALDLKQTFKTANANTNFRVTVNGVQVGPTYRPPFDPTNPATPIEWKKIYVDLTSYVAAGNTIEIGLESSVSEPFANGSGPANLIDNLRVVRFDPTGVADKVFQNSVSVYPNPSNGVFTVTLPTAKTYILEVTDLTGKLIMTQNANGGNNQLNLEGTAQGIYLLKVSGENGTAVRKLIVE